MRLNHHLNLRLIGGHLLFWACAFLLMLLPYFWFYGTVSPSEVRSNFVDHLFYALLVSFHYFVLLPRLLEKGKYLLFLISLILSFVAVILLKVTVEGWLDMTVKSGYHHNSKFVALALIYAAILTSAKLFRKQQEHQKLKVLLAKAEKEKLSAELKALKAQIHPHFLFNTLNNIYSLSVKKSEKTSDYILTLSQLLSYIIYDSAEQLVDLRMEIEFIQHYISLEKIRLSDEHDISVSIDGKLEGHKIAPLLLVTLVENAFTHGAKSTNIAFELTAQLSEHDGRTVFKVRCKNTVEPNQNTSDSARGIGLKNLRERLERIYPNRHHLEINQTRESYCVDLSLTLNEHH